MDETDDGIRLVCWPIYVRCYCYRAGRKYSCSKPYLPPCELEDDKRLIAEAAQRAMANDALEGEA